jgi:hypothetical protein
MRIDQSKSIAIRQVLERHPLKQRGLAGACLSNDVDMRKTVLLFDSKNTSVVSVVDSS